MDNSKGVISISQEMECMCQQCGMFVYLPEDDVVMQDPSSVESKLIDIMIACQNCGGQLALVGKAGDEPHCRVE